MRLNESNIFEKASVLNAQEKKETALTELNALINNSKTDYKYIAELKKAGIYLSSNKKEEALSSLKTIYESNNAPSSLKNIALLSYVGHQVESGNSESLISLLTPLLDQRSAYFAAAIELKTALLLKQNKKEEAKKSLQDALLNPNLTPNATDRINMLLSGL